jgi:hypothetical protein
VVGGCVGTTDRDEFDAIIQERGGGVTAELPVDAVAAVADELGVDDFEMRLMSVSPPNQLAVIEVRDPAIPANLDRYTVRKGSVESVEPVRLSASDNLDAETFLASTVAFDRLDEMADTAVAGFDPEGYVTSIVVSGGGETPEVRLSLESPRASGTATFTSAGELVEVVRS